MLLRSIAVRIPVYVCAVLIAISTYQCGRTREAKAELADIKRGESRQAMQVAANVMANFHRELLETNLWLQRFYQADEGLRRAKGLWRDDRPDFDGIFGWGVEMYLRQRSKGASVEAARKSIATAIRRSNEWRAIHRD
jgi:hypothetical protein